MKTTAVSLTIIMIVLFSSFCAEARSAKKISKEKEKQEKIKAAKKQRDEAHKAYLLVSRQLTSAKNRIKYGDSVAASFYRPIAQNLSDSLEICQLKLSSATICLELSYGRKIKTVRAGKGKIGKSIAQSSSPINLGLGSGAPNCSGGKCGGYSERRNYMRH